MFVSPQNLYIEIFPNVMVNGVKAFGRWLGNEDSVLKNEIRALIIEAPESCFIPSTM